jgi:hypothetical protein
MPYKDPAEAKAYKKLWNEKNKEEQRLYNAEYVKQNKEKISKIIPKFTNSKKMIRMGDPFDVYIIL